MQIYIWWKKYNLNLKWNKDKYRCKCKKHHACEKEYIWNPATRKCKNGKYLVSITDDSVISCGEFVEETNAVPTNINEKI